VCFGRHLVIAHWSHAILVEARGLVYNDISHNDSVTVVPSFYFYFNAVGRGKER
jgi:hypothetical protein